MSADGVSTFVLSSNKSLEAGKWYHVAATFSTSTTAQLFINGKLDKVQNSGLPGSIFSGSAPVLVGSFGVAVGDENKLDGLIDELRIWDVVRTDYEIAEAAHAKLNGDEFGLVSYYNFDEQDGIIVRDQAGNNDGIIGNSAGQEWGESGAFAPFLYQATNAAIESFDLNWAEVPSAESYLIAFTANPSFNSELLQFFEINEQSGSGTVSTSLLPGTKYYAKVAFKKGNYTSPASNVTEFMTVPGYALSFSGNTSGEVVIVPANPTLNLGVGTWEAWVNMQALETSRIIFKDNGAGLGMYELFYNDINSRFEVEIKVATTTYQAISSVVSSTGTWNHLAGVFDGTSLKMYLNGDLTETTTISGVIDANPGALGIGGDPDGNISSNAIIDEVRIWNTPLLESEIQNNMFRTLTGSEAGLVAYYRFDETTGSVLPDLSVNGNTGTLVNSPAWVSSNAFELDTGGPVGVVYVKSDASGNNDGTSWADAFVDLQAALAAVVDGDQIWIANGTYKPDGSAPGNTSLSFIVSVNDLSIFGGFSGTESSLAERYADPSQTVLTGDLNGDDDLIFSNMLDNTNNVVLINNVTGVYIDGLTIKGGNAAVYGGGISSSAADFTLNEVFVEYCIAGTSGGGAYVVGGDVTILNSHFQNNYATTGGGAYLNTSEPFIYRSVFQYNDAVSGGGLYLDGSNLIDNSVSYYNKFLYNGATAVTGGGVYLKESYFEAFQNLFAGNNAYDYGGAIHVDNLSTFVSVNSTIADNASNDGTGGLNFSSGATILINNTIFWGNTSAAQLSSYQSINNGGAFAMNNSIVQEWDKNIYTAAAANNVNNFDPLFVNSANGDYRLLLASAAIDIGNNIALEQPFYIDIFDEDQDADYLEYAPLDLAKNPRYYGSSVDAGAFEHQGGPDPVPFLYVDSNASGNNDGTSWADAFNDLQDALAAATVGTEIWVAAGTYYPSGDDPSVSFVIPSGVSLYGGFSGTETDLSQRDVVSNITILEGDSPNFLNSYLVVYIAGSSNNARLDGFTISGGNGEYGTDNYGGGIKIEGGAEPVLANLTIQLNQNDFGAGLYVNGGIVTIDKSNFVSNAVINFGTGGAIYADNAVLIITNTRFADNTAWESGGIYLSNSSLLTAVNVDFDTNSAFGLNGGALEAVDSDVSITNGRFYNNYGNPGAGILFSSTSADHDLELSQTTFTTSSSSDGVAIQSSGGFYSSATITNSIFWANVGSQINIVDDGSNLSVSNSIIDAWNITDYAGFSGSIMESNVGTGDPLFTSIGTGDLTITEGSSAQDFGDVLLLPFDDLDIDGDDVTVEVLPLDLAGNPRVSGIYPDAGAYELQVASSPFVVTESNSQITPGPLEPETYNVVVAGIRVDVTQNTHLNAITFTTNTDLYGGLENYRLYFSANETFDYPGDTELSASPFASITEISFSSMAFELGIGQRYLYLVADVASNANPTTPPIMFSMNETGIVFGSGTVAPFTYVSTEATFTSNPLYTVVIVNETGSGVAAAPGQASVVLMELLIEATPYGEMTSVAYDFSQDPASNLQNYRLIVSIDDDILTPGDNDTYGYTELSSTQVAFFGIAGGLSGSGKYFFLVADVPALPPGTVTPITFSVNTGSFGINFGSVAPTSITSDPLTVTVPGGPFVVTQSNIEVEPSPVLANKLNIVVAGIMVTVTEPTALTGLTFTTDTDITASLTKFRLFYSNDWNYVHLEEDLVSNAPGLSTFDISFSSLSFALGVGNHYFYLVADVKPDATPSSEAITFSMDETDLSFTNGTVDPFTYNSTTLSFTADPNIYVTLTNNSGGEVFAVTSQQDVVLLEGFVEADPYGEFVGARLNFSSDPLANLENFRLIVSDDDALGTPVDNIYGVSELNGSYAAFNGLTESIYNGAGKYFFFVADVQATAPGTGSPVIFSMDNGSLTPVFGTVTGISILSDPLTVLPPGVNPPIVSTNTGFTLNEGANHVITTSQLSGSDADLPPASSLVFNITAAPAFGQVLKSGLSASSFTQQDLITGLVSYQHDGTENFTDSFSFTLTDGTYTTVVNTLNITVNPVNDAPVFVAQSFTTVENDAAFEAQLVFSDVDSNPLSFFIVSGNTGGTFAVDPSTGLITVAQVVGLDYETTPEFQLNVGVTDAVDSVIAIITIQLTDEPETPVALAADNVTTFGFTAYWSQLSGVDGYRLEVATDALFTTRLTGFDPKEQTDTTVIVTGLYHASSYYYRLKAFAGTAETAYSNTIEVKTLHSAELTSDSTALVKIYDEMGGAGWTNSANWKAAQVRGWSGVVVENSRVTGLNLPSNNVTGAFPTLTGTELNALVQLDLANNQITTVPANANLAALQVLDLSSNQLDFGSLEQFAGVTTFSYSPQADLFTAVDLLQERGEPLSIDRTSAGASNQYQWYKNGTAIDGATGPVYTIAFPTFAEEGSYTAQVSNTQLPNLTLTTLPITLRVSSLERDRLILTELYNLTAGDSWNNNTNWNTADIASWFGITVANDRVTGITLPSNNLVGELPLRLGDMRRLTAIDISNNEVISLPALTNIIELATFNVSNNRLQFDDLEHNIGIASINYAPQKLTGQARDEKIAVNTAVTVEVPVGGTANSYQWYHNGSSIAAGTSSTYQLGPIRYENMGSYELEITSSKVAGLTLRSEVQRVLGTAMITGSIIDLNNASVANANGALLGVKTGAYDTTGFYTSSDNGVLTINDVVLGDYLLYGEQDKQVYIPSYYRSTIDWVFADLIQLRDNIADLVLTMVNVPRELTPADGDNTFKGLFESDFGDTGSKVLDRSRVQGAGVSVSRSRFRAKDNEDDYELIAYVQTDETGQFEMNNLPDGDYRVNIQYPGIPMDPTSFIDFQLGGGSGVEQNSIRINALATPTKIVVTKVEETGIYLDYFKGLVVYPNPADDYITIRYEKLVKGDVFAELTDLTGQAIMSKEVRQGTSQQTVLDLTDVKNGLYILRFFDKHRNGVEIASFRLIVKK